MDNQTKATKNAIIAILNQVDELSEVEQLDFWNHIDSSFEPEVVKALRDVNEERQMVKGIAGVFQNTQTETGEPIQKIAFVAEEEDPFEDYEIDLETGLYS